MCGIVGFYDNNNLPGAFDDLRCATRMLKHRGPDATGTYEDRDDRVAFGHCRLSILDLTPAGSQPMQSEDGTVAVVYNGEIYNFKEVRQQLSKLGFAFKSESDTEVILNGYRAWGMDCLQRFVGMFAIGIYDRVRRRLYLVRDRLGIKPLYYFYNDRSLIFASELKAIMAFRAFPKAVDPEALGLFLHYQYVPGPKTIFQHTYKLSPGCFLTFDGYEITRNPYWSPADGIAAASDESIADENEAVEKLDDLLTQAVADCLVSDVPLGALLSGGIDSSLVAAMMQKAGAAPAQTFSIGFRHRGYDEAPWARKIAAHLGTHHTELYLDANQSFDIVTKLPDIYDEPFADTSAIPTFLVSRLTRSHVKVALSGDGGDELFAGYIRYGVARSAVNGLARLPKKLKRALAGGLAHLPATWVEKCYLPLRDCLPRRFQVANVSEKWQKLVLLLNQDRLSELYRMTICVWAKEDVEKLTGRPLPDSRFETLFLDNPQQSVLDKLMHVDRHTYLPDGMLTKVDRASMACGLEARVPLLDHRVVEFAVRLPESYKYRNGAGKFLLKKLLARYVPRHLFDRPKMGFGVPMKIWLQGPLKPVLQDYLSPARLSKEGLLDAAFVNHKVGEHMNAINDHHYRLWAILMWEMWRERWLH